MANIHDLTQQMLSQLNTSTTQRCLPFLLQRYSNTPYMITYILCGVTQMIVNIVGTYKYKMASRSVTRKKGYSGILLIDRCCNKTKYMRNAFYY